MQRGSKFSFGGALMPDWPAAPGYSLPGELAPGAWCESFVKQNKSDPGVLTGLLTSCRAGRDQALQSASHVTLSLNTISETGDPAAWRRRMGVLGAALQARGPKPTRLSITYSDSVDSFGLCALALPLLKEAPAAFKELSLHLIESYDDNQLLAARVVHMVTEAASQLTRLDVISPHISLPHPFSLPNLQYISVDLRTEPVWHTTYIYADSISALAPYLPQLMSLSLTVDSPQGTLWEELFFPGVVSHSLTHFATSTWLTDELMRRLLTHTPALKELRVADLHLAEPVTYGHRQWGLERLVCQTGAEAEVLAGLPASTAGTVSYKMQYLMMSADSVEGFAPNIRALLPTWRIGAGVSFVSANTHLLPHEQPTALRNTLTQLGSGWLAAGALLRLRGWPCTAATLQALAECVPALAQQDHRVQYEPCVALTDDVLGALLSVTGPPVQCVFEFDSVELQSDQHSGAVWPWVQRLSVGTVNVSQLARLPQPGGVGGPREVCCDYLVIDESVREVDMSQLTDRLSHMRWGARQLAVQIRFSGLGDADTPLSSQLFLLHALRFSTPEDQQAAHLCLTGLTMTHDTVQALTALPRLGGTLHLAGCTWPQEPAQYAQLAHTVPVSFSKWRISGMPKGMYDAVCEAIQRGRESEGLGAITLVWSEVTQVDEEPIEMLMDGVE